jgi:formylglycine-generating enzyme required for sulfatase activity
VFGLSTPRVRFDGFWIDRYEVTNHQYKAFVDAGGDQRPEFWQQPFVKDGRMLSFEEGVGLFPMRPADPAPQHGLSATIRLVKTGCP